MFKINIKNNGENALNENVTKEVFNEFLGLLDMIGDDFITGYIYRYGAYDGEYIYNGDNIMSAEIVGIKIDAFDEEWFETFQNMFERAKQYKTIRRPRKAA